MAAVTLVFSPSSQYFSLPFSSSPSILVLSFTLTLIKSIAKLIEHCVGAQSHGGHRVLQPQEEYNSHDGLAQG